MSWSRGGAILAGLLALMLHHAPAHAQRIPDAFRDPEDGRLDFSDYLLNRKGVLPIPIIITEPALGYGGGLFITFFSQSMAERARTTGRFAPPTVTGGGGFYTSNGSYGGTAFVFHPFRQDRFRLLAALGGASLNLDFFGFDPEGPLADNPIAYTIEPLFAFTRFQGRVSTTPLFVGLQYSYLRTKSRFEGTVPPEIEAFELDEVVGGFGGGLEFDTRDNLLDARRGVDFTATGMWFGPSLGGDESFALFDIQGLLYGQPTPRWGYGLRVESGLSSGDPPFFEKPSLSMRGLPAVKYLNNTTLLGEAELRYSTDTRWTLLAFGGGGRVAASWHDLDEASSVFAGGTGFRYLMARQLGLSSGLDFAWGPGGEFAFYIQMGSAWR
jgi:hypothetical protein